MQDFAERVLVGIIAAACVIPYLLVIAAALCGVFYILFGVLEVFL